ncbi:cystatin-like [Spea bombifrons]|uniref:cystatin-like n=1 Tax=Spea bombifrons TaxID=233779 RepID=UPI00234ABDAE|nr:cystatin-like [Spea bombifrons]
MIKLILVVGLCALAVVATGQRRPLGAPANADPSEEGVRRAMSFALHEYNKASNDMYAHKIEKINSVTKQIVSGVNYVFDVDITRTKCRKPTSDLANCESYSDPGSSKAVNCLFTVYSVPWLGTHEVKKTTCS